MAPKKNLLEAFRDAGDGKDSNEPSHSAGPFAPPAPTPEKEKPKRASAPASSASAPRAVGLPVWVLGAALVGAVFVIGVVIGRSSSGGENETHAAETDLTQLEIPPTVQGPNRGDQGGPNGSTARNGGDPASTPRGTDGNPNAPLFDAKNRYTVIVVTYGRTKEDLALATQDLLEASGLPVFEPVARPNDILILVGAAPERADLTGIEARVRSLADWSGAKNAYEDAYIESIDKLIRR